MGAAKLLIEAGTNVRTVNKQGRSALDLAESCNRKDMFELLSAHRR